MLISLFPVIFFELPIIRTIFNIPRRFELSGVDCKGNFDYSGTLVDYFTIIPLARMGSESIVHEAEGQMGY